MRSSVILVFCLILVQSAAAQSFADSVQAWRKNYREAFLKEERSPLGKSDLKHLRFYAPDPAWVLWGNFEPLQDTVGFEMETHSGVKKHYYRYGNLRFEREGKAFSLTLYRSRKLMQMPGHEDDLFLPFFDETNYSETYGGGRYIDLKTGDVQGGVIRVDFNLAYNPYCAFKGGYACPVPPAENRLSFPVRAGERLFARAPKEGH